MTSVELGDDEAVSGRYKTSANLFTILVALKLAFMVNFVHMVSWNLYEIYLTEVRSSQNYLLDSRGQDGLVCVFFRSTTLRSSRSTRPS